MKRVAIYAASGVVAAGLAAILEEAPDLEVVARLARDEDVRSLAGDGDIDVLVAAITDEPVEEFEIILLVAPAVVILTSRAPERWLGIGLGLGAFALLSASAAPDEIRAATLSVAAGLFVTQSTQLARLAIVPSPALVTGGFVEQLTARESEVLSLMAEGLGNKTIAYRLGISDHTVKFHVGSILRKLDAESRTEAVTEGIRRGYITV